ncbi:MAG TPA: GIY-YIG nuclease family protein [Kofleriaceae bacterium]|jgi:hypothetical protein
MPVLYFIQSGGGNGPVKIGWAGDLRIRIGTLQVGNPRPLRILFAHEAADAADLERRVHRELSSLRMRGEWFRYSRQIREVISAIADGSFDVPVPIDRAANEAAFSKYVADVQRWFDDRIDGAIRALP